jgi:hypothetical protein
VNRNAPLRIGLIAEGEAELGPSVPYIRPQDGGTPIELSQEGALHTIIRREIQESGLGDCIFIQRHPTANELRIKKRRTGFGVLDPKYLAQTVVAWKPSEVDNIVILVDSDEQIDKRQGDLKKALQVIAANHFDENNQLRLGRSCGGLAIKSFDTWMIADRKQIQRLLNATIEVALPDNLETLPGDSRDMMCTKTLLNTLISQSDYATNTQSQLGNPDLRARWQLAFIINLDELKTRCKNGYGVFALALQEMVKAINLSKRDDHSHSEGSTSI